MYVRQLLDITTTSVVLSIAMELQTSAEHCLSISMQQKPACYCPPCMWMQTRRQQNTAYHSHFSRTLLLILKVYICEYNPDLSRTLLILSMQQKIVLNACELNCKSRGSMFARPFFKHPHIHL